MHLRRPNFLFWFERGGRFYIIWFPMCFHQVPNSNGTSIPYTLTKVEFIHIYYKGGPKGNTFVLLFWGVPNHYINMCLSPLYILLDFE
jgi:hypothetical protein